MNSIILIAPPAGGKGTHASLLTNEYKIPHISIGELLRGAANDTSETALMIKKLQAEGILVPIEIVMELISERIQKDDCKNGYILDGFPRSIEQATQYDKLLEKLGKDIGKVILLNLDKEIAKSRIVNRLSCPKCGRVYNSANVELMPKVEGKCDDCDVSLIHRSDDNAETYEKRYQVYITETQPVIDYYKEKGVLYEIDSSIGKDLTYKEIKKILETN